MGYSSNLAAEFDTKQQKHIKSVILYPEEALFLAENVSVDWPIISQLNTKKHVNSHGKNFKI